MRRTAATVPTAAAGLRHNRGPAAFSLVEVLCAILILGVALAGLTGGITTALSSSKEAELQTAAALIAAGRVELLRADGYLIDGESEGECQDGLELYRWKEAITSASIDGLHEVVVTVQHARTGRMIYELRTLLFDPPAVVARETTSRRPDAQRRERGKP